MLTSKCTLRYGNKSSPFDVTAAMLVKRTITKIRLYYYAKLKLHFSIVLAPTWPSYHVTVIKLRNFLIIERRGGDSHSVVQAQSHGLPLIRDSLDNYVKCEEESGHHNQSVGHLACDYSRISWYFLARGGKVTVRFQVG